MVNYTALDVAERRKVEIITEVYNLFNESIISFKAMYMTVNNLIEDEQYDTFVKLVTKLHDL